MATYTNSAGFTHQEKVQMIRKKAQEEMIGFVMIMLVLAIIFVIFLGIFIRLGPQIQSTESTEVSQFLDSLLQYTTECTHDGGYTYKNIEDLISACHDGGQCISEDYCVMLRRTIKEIIETSWNFGPESPERSYEFKASYIPAGTEEKLGISDEFNTITNGELCGAIVRGAEKPVYVQDGKITIELRICGNTISSETVNYIN